MEPILVGIDVSRDRVHLAVTDTAGQTHYGHGGFANTAAGAAALLAALTTWIPTGSTGVRIGLEATGVYAWHLALFLSQAPALTPCAATVSRLQPRAVHRYIAAFASRRSKTDPQDAWHIAAVLGQPAWLPHPFRMTERTVGLQRLTRHRRHLVQTLAGMKNYGARYLFWQASGLTLDPPWADPWGASAAGILTRYATSEDIAAAPLDDLVRDLGHDAHGRLADPAAVARDPAGRTRLVPPAHRAEGARAPDPELDSAGHPLPDPADPRRGPAHRARTRRDHDPLADRTRHRPGLRRGPPRRNRRHRRLSER